MVQVYVKAKRFVQVTDDKVWFRDLAEVSCQDKSLENKIRCLQLYHFNCDKASGEEKERVVISTLVLVRKIEELCPQVAVELLGEPDILVQRIRIRGGKAGTVAKILLVCLVSFFGTGFTIMAYHNDVGIVRLFREVYHILMGEYQKGPSVLEISYSLGLAAGILLFYNHIGKRKLTKDPTPMEVAMYEYEQSVDYTLIELADRQAGQEADQ